MQPHLLGEPTCGIQIRVEPVLQVDHRHPDQVIPAGHEPAISQRDRQLRLIREPRLELEALADHRLHRFALDILQLDLVAAVGQADLGLQAVVANKADGVDDRDFEDVDVDLDLDGQVGRGVLEEAAFDVEHILEVNVKRCLVVEHEVALELALLLVLEGEFALGFAYEKVEALEGLGEVEVLLELVVVDGHFLNFVAREGGACGDGGCGAAGVEKGLGLGAGFFHSLKFGCKKEVKN